MLNWLVRAAAEANAKAEAEAEAGLSKRLRSLIDRSIVEIDSFICSERKRVEAERQRQAVRMWNVFEWRKIKFNVFACVFQEAAAAAAAALAGWI